MAKSPIVGVAYRSQSPNLALDRAVNLYVETVETKTGKVPWGMFGSPGLRFLLAIDVGPLRGVHPVGTTLYAVSGSGFYLITPGYSATLLGNLQTTSGPVSIIDNGSQVAVSDGQAIYVWSGGMFVVPKLSSINPPGTLVYQDTLGVYNELGSPNLWQSAIGDLTSWPPLNNDVADGSPSNIVGLAEQHRQILVIKEKNTEYWINAGNPGFVFQRREGVFPNIGAAAPASICRVGENVLWLSRNDIGEGQVVMVSGYEPQRMSTYAIEAAIGSFGDISDAVGFGTLLDGHSTYVLNFPTGGKTYALDLTVTQQLGVPAWHELAGFSGGSFTNYEGVCACLFAGQVIVGSATGPNLYALDPNYLYDNGNPRKWLRTWRGVADPDQRKSRRFAFLELDYMSGIGVPPGANPQFVLRYTDDAHVWSSEIFCPAGKSGQTAWQARFNRLGMCPRGSASDRVFELSSTDPFKTAIFGADLD